MMIVLGIILIVLSVLSLAGAVFWLAVLAEVVWMVRKLPTARDGLSGEHSQIDGGSGGAAGSSAPGVCLIIPAYNEEKSIECVARSLLQQDYANLRVVFALDRCTDDTEGVLRRTLGDDARFSIYKISECPPDWAGKVNAVWRAVSAAPAAQGAEIIAFADADTQFDPGCIRACVAILRRQGYGLLSLMSTLTCEHWFEKVVQPVAGYELMRQFPPRRVNREGAPGQRRAVANGQFMMFTRECYWSFGGHENPLVKDELL
ncbi:MAG: glycosyltransferase family 2 protein, partial [Phycisphaerales bacterium]|nr:glycosyltransferase family 2 protein [Phycisphaerales bacterium]